MTTKIIFLSGLRNVCFDVVKTILKKVGYTIWDIPISKDDTETTVLFKIQTYTRDNTGHNIAICSDYLLGIPDMIKSNYMDSSIITTIRHPGDALAHYSFTKNMVSRQIVNDCCKQYEHAYRYLNRSDLIIKLEDLASDTVSTINEILSISGCTNLDVSEYLPLIPKVFPWIKSWMKSPHIQTSDVKNYALSIGYDMDMSTRDYIKTHYNFQLSKYKNVFKKLEQIVASTGEHVEGNCFHIDGQRDTIADSFLTKRLNLFHYATSADTIMEIGFNGGHSCLLFLLANPRSKINLFDLGNHRYSKLAFDYLSNMFPGRLTIVWGDSRKSLVEFITHTSYDMIHIDGGHTREILHSDIDKCSHFSSNETIVVVDDISFHPDHMVEPLSGLVIELLIVERIVQTIPPFFSNFHIVVKFV